MLVLVLSMCLASVLQRCLRAYAPSNAIVSTVRRQRPSAWIAGGLVALTAVFALGAILAADWGADGGPGWLQLMVPLWTWNAMKFAWAAAMCPVWNLAGRKAARR